MATVEVVAPDITKRLAAVERRITTAKKSRSDLDASYRAKRDALALQIKQLEDERRDLKRSGSKRRDRGPLDAHKQAGKRNIRKMLDAAQKARTATQADLARLSGVGTGSTTWAIRALVADGVLQDTGERRDGSRVYRYVSKRSGSSRVLGPGA